MPLSQPVGRSPQLPGIVVDAATIRTDASRGPLAGSQLQGVVTQDAHVVVGDGPDAIERYVASSRGHASRFTA